MPDPNRTKSETLFEELCDLHGVEWTRIPVRPDRRQPDYELSLGGNRVVAEVKQIEPNQDDKKTAEAYKRDGKASGRRNPNATAQRVRDDIGASRGQFRAYLEDSPGVPAILVLFDNAGNGYDDPYTIQTAMHGTEEAVISLASGSPVIVDQGFGARNNREIRPGKNQHLSALATLREFSDFDTHERRLGLCFYHNNLAEVLLPPDWWVGEHIVHCKLSAKTPGQWQNWEQIKSESEYERQSAGRGGGRTIYAATGNRLGLSDSVGWKSWREFYERKPTLSAVVAIISLASPFVGLVLDGSRGIVVGAILSALSYFLSPMASKLVRETKQG